MWCMSHFIPAEAKSSGCRILGPRENIHLRRSGSGSGSPWTPGALEPSLSHTNAPTPRFRQAPPPPHNHTYNSKAHCIITRESLITSIQVLFTFIFNDLIMSGWARQIGTCGLLWANFKDLWFCDKKIRAVKHKKTNCFSQDPISTVIWIHVISCWCETIQRSFYECGLTDWMSKQV